MDEHNIRYNLSVCLTDSLTSLFQRNTWKWPLGHRRDGCWIVSKPLLQLFQRFMPTTTINSPRIIRVQGQAAKKHNENKQYTETRKISLKDILITCSIVNELFLMFKTLYGSVLKISPLQLNVQIMKFYPFPMGKAKYFAYIWYFWTISEEQTILKEEINILFPLYPNNCTE